MKPHPGPSLIAAAMLLQATAAGAATQTCVGSATTGAGVAVASMVMQDQLMKSMGLLITRPAVTTPGQGASGGGEVRVQLDMKLTMADEQTFDGLGVALTFANKAVTGPIDLRITAAGVEAGRGGVTPNPDGSYTARLGGGPLKGNVLGDALDRADAVRVVAVLSSAKDQVLVDVEAPIGTVKQRQDLGLAAMDDANRKAKNGCPAT